MAKVEFLGPIGRASIEVDIQNLSELKSFFKEDKELQEWLGICAVAINDTLVCEADVPVSSHDKISLLPPVCGG
ncbi:MAG: molybdopterin synthase sulfur carrier subunit [Epsilonproteobacteria bacterium]|uniref:MoaD/ThiS family protein n=1 Tax=Sulfurospirillum TaxID=57665 RepID=UPI000543366D|nr:MULTISPECIES: MoaD/ThiS family protein [Sulfurospirillum]KHG34164.1 MAG: molybdenum cofactor biosynthesis protein MoaD [Sulfurospirillum sp. MES]MDY0263809.1 MoaD/ThiS family protein [Sulfurospirillum cavolei]NCB54623.1 molybdopterin synthase sulfur carrier subunit [Campylobacterota bacterium]